MDYNKHHLFDWLSKRPLLKIEHLEKLAGCPESTIRHFLKERRDIPNEHFESVCDVLSDYGYIPESSE